MIFTLLFSSLSISASSISPISKEYGIGGFECNSSASWNEHFESETEMIDSSDIVIHGTVISNQTELRYDTVFTRNFIKVTLVNKGNIEIDSIITVLQTGGTYLEYSSPAISEIPLLEIGKEYALYLTLTDYSETYGQYYLISGGYQGVMEINNDGSLVTLSDQNEIFSLLETSPATISGLSVTNTPTKSYYWNKSSLVVYVQGDIRDRYHSNTRIGICNGIQAWEKKTDSPSTSITLSTVNADVCVYMYDYGATGWDAQTDTYYDNSNICDYSRIKVNAHNLTNYYSLEGLWQALACHEFGHTLGLNHNDSGSASIMRSYTLDYYNYSGLLPRYKVPQTADINSINSKY